MQIFSANQLYQADQITLKRQGISAVDLMERTATLAFKKIDQFLQHKPNVHIFCGTGNNGGDGLVLARLLSVNGYNVKVYQVQFSEQFSECYKANLNRLKYVPSQTISNIQSSDDFPEIKADEVIIDCVFGIGLNRAPHGWVKALIQYLNQQKAKIIAIDIPSGLFANQPLTDSEAVVKADYTITFQSPKITFLLPETGNFVGELKVLDIGLDKAFLSEQKPLAKLTEKTEIQSIYKPRNPFSHKGTFGHTLIVGGSHGKMGAVCLSATAALRSGAGLVSAFVPKGGNDIVQIAVPEAMTINDENDKIITQITVPEKVNAIAVGMGMGQENETFQALKKLFKEKVAFVIDADAINCVSKDTELLNTLPKNSILTPHEGELKRLLGEWKNDFDKIEKAQLFSKKHQVTLLIKGAFTVIVDGDNLYFNSTGNPGMATAGSGDALSGILAGLLSQGYTTLEAALLGTYLHGKSGDLAVQEQKSEESIIASDIIQNLGKAYSEIRF